MANSKHVEILKQGVETWNQWREENPDVRPDLRLADLRGVFLGEVDLIGADLFRVDLREVVLTAADLIGADLRRADLREAHLIGADLREGVLIEANLSGADLRGAFLRGANLRGADLFRAYLLGADVGGANLSEANLSEANLHKTQFNGAELAKANLMGAALLATNLRQADLTGCSVYGISAWNLDLTGAKQTNLVITPEDEPVITVDNLEVAQFIYLMLNNEKIRDVINTITTKVVLILGRFTPERKAVLDAIRDELRRRDYLPVLFDFDKPASRDLTETVRTLAHMARFIIADITEPRSIPLELQAIVPDLAVPVQPLLLEGSSGEFGMFQDLERKYHWVLTVYQYKDPDTLLASLGEEVIAPAEAKVRELQKR